MEEVLKEEIKRPWQSWLFVGLFSLGLFSSFCIIIYEFNTSEIDHILYGLFSDSFVSSLAIFVGVSSLFSPLALNLFVWSQNFIHLDISILLIVINFFLFICISMRYRMALLVISIFYALSILDFSIMVFIHSDKSLSAFAFFLVLLLVLFFCLYLSISCLNHPFYNQKKIK